MYLILALLAFGSPVQQDKANPTPVADDALLQLMDEDVNIFAHLAAVIAADGNLEECCPDDGEPSLVDAFKVNGDLLVFTGEGDKERLQILRQDTEDMFSTVFDAHLVDIQFGEASEVTNLVNNAMQGQGEVTCIRIDNNTILCAWSEPPRIIILCRQGTVWIVCFDSNRINR